ncbi:MAG: hypothetical protein L0Z54_02110 [Thermoplasmata archaeon]|nr:hypothetical protein [Thermoplasmata archaeon]
MTRTKPASQENAARALSREELRQELDAHIADRIRRRVQEIDEAWPWSTEDLI